MFASRIVRENERAVAALAAEYPEARVLGNLAHTFNNFLPGFRGRTRRTFVVSPEDSQMFPMERIAGAVYFGIPEIFFEDFLRLPLYGARYFPGRPGVYLVFAMGPSVAPEPAALRIYQRPARVRVLAGHDQLYLAATTVDGRIRDLSPQGCFPVELTPAREMDWEAPARD